MGGFFYGFGEANLNNAYELIHNDWMGSDRVALA